jgi:hypothetical protein
LVGKKESDKKAKFLSTDLDIEYFELLDNLIAEKRLGSRREGLTVVFKGYLQSLNPSSVEVDPTVCEFLSDDKSFCCKNRDKIKKISAKECNACQKAQKTLEKNQRMEELKLHGQLLRYDLTERMWIFELGVPFEKTGYDTFNRLVFLKDKFDQKDKELERLSALENDNAFLKQQLSEKDHEIKDMKAEIKKQEVAINAYMFQRQTIENP